MFNRTDIKTLCKLFPQLTEVQAEHAIMYSLGSTKAQIAETRKVTVASVKKSLDMALLKMEISHLSTLRQIVLSSIFCSFYTMLSRLSSQSTTESN